MTGAALVAGGMTLYPQRIVYTEGPSPERRRKPIYDDDALPTIEAKAPPVEVPETTAPADLPSESTPPTLSRPATPTPTDRLAQQVRQARLFLFAHSLAAENSFNDALSRALHAESRFTSTIASLAPPRESGERLLPGSIYVLVSAMAGSIVSRNRGILLRTATPVAVGTIAAWTLLPITMRNVSDLVFEFEKKMPGLAEQHVRVRDRAEQSWQTAIAHSGLGRVWLEDKIGEGRETLEGWIKKGR
ncbi:hypothetical protein AJ80_08484 [Polytolypa hystricis UAMH7299]|uniref:MICOS complex subunit n=1 Tax=Polytolypa hystricis (strain UAMH7299) TaxID=1447883 RepID=A0A2B7X6Z8_POLH7|nr:hypothetical protein AJ80_08484 [Polytolypa hystricis UAMH7299]